MQRHENIHDVARGKWPNLLTSLGVPAQVLNGKHQPCPMCGGSDRFRFTDHGGTGAYICNQCGNGTGVDLLIKLKGLSFKEVATEVRQRVGGVAATYTKATEEQKDFAKFGKQLWDSSEAMSDTAGAAYLAKRGIKIMPREVRFNKKLRYKFETGTKVFCGMFARFVGPDSKSFGYHRTYLTEDGDKAQVEKPKTFYPGSIPPHGAVRLANSAETMGIAEGIETALSAMQLFDVPVWAACDAGKMYNWKPPASVKHVIIFADHDGAPHYTGQRHAYNLAERLWRDKIGVEVRLPDLEGSDWNDVLMGQAL